MSSLEALSEPLEDLHEWLVTLCGISDSYKDSIIESLSKNFVCIVEDLLRTLNDDPYLLSAACIPLAYELQIFRTLNLPWKETGYEEKGSPINIDDKVSDFASSKNLGQQLPVIEADKLVVDTTKDAIGVGSFGVVFKGLYDGKEVAVKQIRDSYNKEMNDKLQYGLLQEAALLVMSRGSNGGGVIYVYGVDNLTKPTMIVMELAKFSLAQLLYDEKYTEDKSRLTVPVKLRMMHECCECLAWLHTNQIIHRDIKPANLLIKEDFSIRLSDFGLAKKRGTFTSTADSVAKGTLPYKAPELLKYEDSYKSIFNESTDMYAFTISLNEVLNETEPFQDFLEEHHILVGMNDSDFTLRPNPYEYVDSPQLCCELKCLLSIGWHVEAKLRPSFEAMSCLLSEILTFTRRSVRMLSSTHSFDSSDPSSSWSPFASPIRMKSLSLLLDSPKFQVSARKAWINTETISECHEYAFTSHFNSQGTKLVTASGTVIKMWDLTTTPCQQVTSYSMSNTHYKVGGFISGDKLVLATIDGIGKMNHQLNYIRQTIPPNFFVSWLGNNHYEYKNMLLFVVSPNCFMAGSFHRHPDGHSQLKVWDLIRKKYTGSIDDVSAIDCMDLANNGLLACGTEKMIKLWNVNTGELLHTFEGLSSFVYSIKFDPSASRIASGGSYDCKVLIWDASTGSCLFTLLGHSSFVWNVVWSCESSFLLSASSDKTVKVWCTVSGTLIQSLEGHKDKVNGVSINEEGSLIVTTSNDRRIRIWSYTELDE